MTEGEVRQLAQMHALVAQVEAIKAEVAGMTYENERRIQNNETPAYSDLAFFACSRQLHELAKKLQTEI